MVEIIRGVGKKPVARQSLDEFFTNKAKYTGTLYFGFPSFPTSEGPCSIDAIFVSREKGVILFDLAEQNILDPSYRETQDNTINLLDAKLRLDKSLMDRRKLRVPVHIVTYASLPFINSTPDAEYPFCHAGNLEEWIDSLDKWSDSACYPSLLATIQSISTLRKSATKRHIQKPDSRGAKLKRLEDSIANLDLHQSRAVIETVSGVQRIRGLAGSGKTIVLALKAVYLHAQYPHWNIAVTFFTQPLKEQFYQLIRNFYVHQTGEEPNWDHLHIIHAWGSPGGAEKLGIYYNFCKKRDVEYHDYESAKALFGHGNEFSGACEKAINESQNSSFIYDAILIDDAQNFSSSFLNICYELINPENRHLVYAYDELQSLNRKSLPPPEEIFGKDACGNPRVSFNETLPGNPRQDIILEKCYRNSRPVLVTAHALGFGIYRKHDSKTGSGLVQIFDRAELWNDFGYSVMDGELADGKNVTLARHPKSSPEFLENHSHVDDIIKFIHFNSKEEQDNWVTNDILDNINKEELHHDDIIVINPNPKTTRQNVGEIRKQLFENKVGSHFIGVDTMQNSFHYIDSIAFSGIHRAKGNEAGMVYIINSQECLSHHFNSDSWRNYLFTAITRSKAWVRVLGHGQGMKLILEEFNKIKENNFTLKFRYPTEKEVTVIFNNKKIITEKERNKDKELSKDFEKYLDDFERIKENLMLTDPGRYNKLVEKIRFVTNMI
ncbi:MAG: ATP-binding domain-containing protein [Magnetococcus sp. DMHC-1]